MKFNVVRGDGILVTKFLRAVAAAVLTQRRSVVLDFRKTESFYVAGAIYLLAELNRIINLSNLPKPISIRDPHQRRSREVLKQIGLYELTGDSCDVVPERDDVVYWKATKGFDQSGDKLQMLEAVTERANHQHAQQLALSGMWRGVSEAVANAVEHGYKLPRADGFAGLSDTRWWMFTQLRDGVFSVAVCDLGCGYRATVGLTLPERWLSSFKSLIGISNRDALSIEAAMEYGRSGTKLGERGKGSRDALSVLKGHGQGELLIVSNTGWVSYVYANGQEEKKDHGELGIDIRGTIIWWKLPLKGTQA